jgi:predicted RNase H-like nuclease
VTARVAGADGCRGGWVVVVTDGATAAVEVVPTFAEVVRASGDARVIGVDMPIGFLDAAEPGGRDCDRQARRLLGARGCCVFSPPVRRALRARTYADALAANRASSDARLGISIECFGLFAKLREVDGVLARSPGLRRRVREIHPELAFRAMAGARAGLSPKRSAAGRARRTRLLARHFASLRAGLVRPPRGAALDDVLDAHAVCWSAARIACGSAVCLRGRPSVDRRGRPMAIWY